MSDTARALRGEDALLFLRLLLDAAFALRLLGATHASNRFSVSDPENPVFSTEQLVSLQSQCAIPNDSEFYFMAMKEHSC